MELIKTKMSENIFIYSPIEQVVRKNKEIGLQ
jgi:hypothetical protein